MITRIITALLAGSAWFTMLMLGSYQLCWAIMTIIGFLCSYEYFAMVLEGKDRKFLVPGIICCALPLLTLYTQSLALFNAGLLLGGLTLLLLLLFGYQASDNPFSLGLRLIFGLFYCGFLTGHILMILSLNQGAHWLVALTVITSFSDSGAYFVGKSMGRIKLCPHISPGKTVEGFIGGLLSAALGGVLISMILFPEVNLVKISLWAVVLSALGVAGDLSESIIKRATSSKDSGRILPGHGGVLDRIDSLLFCGPVFYYILYFNLL
jgi:phosphatidate cytidylyltransferase